FRAVGRVYLGPGADRLGSGRRAAGAGGRGARRPGVRGVRDGHNKVDRSLRERIPSAHGSTMFNLPQEIGRYYQEVAEEGRLGAGPSRLECARPRGVVLRYLPPPPATVLDVGGASGAYALWLAERGYRVHLVDPVPRLVEEARRRSEASPNRILT